MLDLATRQAKADQMLRVREVRRLHASEMEMRETSDGRVTFAGLASRTATPYDMGWYDEQIARDAFKQTLSQNPDVQLLVNHDGLPLARTTIPAGQPGSLRLFEDYQGLNFEASCDAADQDVQRLAAKVKSGLMDQCSFAFRVIRQKWTWTEEQDMADSRDQREILEVSLDRGDVSVCNYGANPQTPVTARGLFTDLHDLTEDDLNELRGDPIVLEVIKRLGFVPEQPAPVEVPVETVQAAHDLDFYKARVFTLKARN